jgi:hypothetical protein
MRIQSISGVIGRPSVSGPVTTIILFITLLFAFSAWAADEIPPPNSTAVAPVPSPLLPAPALGIASATPSSSANGTGPAELLQVEAVIGGNLSREWKRYRALADYRPEYATGFADFLYDEYSRRHTSGIMMAGFGAPLIAGFSTLGIVALYRRGKDNGGFCNHREYDELTGDYEETCEGDWGPFFGIMFISLAGGAATLGLLIPGLIKASRYGKRLGRLSPLVLPPRQAGRKVEFTYAVGPRYASFGMLF